MLISKDENWTANHFETALALRQVIIFYEIDVLTDKSIPQGKRDLIGFMLKDMKEKMDECFDTGVGRLSKEKV